MVATRDTLVGKYRTFTTTDTDTVQAFIVLAQTCLAESVWGDRYDQAVELVAAHFLALDMLGKQGAAGAVTGSSKQYTREDGTTESISMNFAGGVGSVRKAMADENLSQTTYGRLFMFLRDATIFPILTELLE